MLTRNFYSHMRATMQKTSADFTMVDGSTGSHGNGEVSTSGAFAPFSAMTTYAEQATARGVSFGTGTTPAKVTDYCLENPITSGLTVITPSATTYNRTEKYEEYTVTFGVTSTNTVTISEIGLKCNPSYTTPNNQMVAMVDRTVLENPIEIPAGQSKQITYTIRFNYPT